MVNSPDVVCLGILVADFFPDPVDKLPVPGELALINSIALSTGGCAANTAVALSKLEVKTGVIGRVGDDEFGGFIRRDLDSLGIDVSRMVVTDQQETSKTIIISVKGEDRRYLHLFGANGGLCAADVDSDYLKQAKVLYVGGFLGMPDFTFDETAALFAEVRRAGVKTVLDVIVPSPGDYASGFAKLLPHVDVFLPNSDEAGVLTGFENPEKQARIFADMGALTVVITMGSDGILARTDGTVIRTGVYDVPFVDGSGAGDAFDAGFIYSMLRGDPIETALKKASAMGASCVRALGCAPGLFSRRELEDYCESHELSVKRSAIQDP